MKSKTKLHDLNTRQVLVVNSWDIGCGDNFIFSIFWLYLRIFSKHVA